MVPSHRYYFGSIPLRIYHNGDYSRFVGFFTVDGGSWRVTLHYLGRGIGYIFPVVHISKHSELR